MLSAPRVAGMTPPPPTLRDELDFESSDDGLRL